MRAARAGPVLRGQRFANEQILRVLPMLCRKLENKYEPKRKRIVKKKIIIVNC